ncbi:hypothetical protein Cni_G18582 [Canna indica]|uniref:Uncharacterized protein n=1 Tax=Canna indica TaxID=4628 RepID=A0AAQ3KJL7_9LILI|nr:hypothetical protein Cni_G18582 [Canna indica]
MANGKGLILDKILREKPLKRLLLGRRQKPDDDVSTDDPIPQLSIVANSVVARCCSRILHFSTDNLQESFVTEFPDCNKLSNTYARDLLEYCCFRALHMAIESPDYLSNKEFRKLTFDMMLAWEYPGATNESLPKAMDSCDNLEDDNDDNYGGEKEKEGEEDCGASARVDYKKTVGLSAFARIAPACPVIADSITVHNLFDALTCSTSGQMCFFTYKKYLKSLQKEIKYTKSVMASVIPSSLHLCEGEIILDVDGIVLAQPVILHIGKSSRPGRLTLTTHALYFEPLGVGYDKAVKYDLATDLQQVVKGELSGPLGARFFDRAVMYKSISLAEPIFIGFPEFKGHSRRDYWLELVREVLQVHKFIRKYNLNEIQQMECLSKAILCIFRYRALKEAFHIFPLRFKSILAFNLAQKLPKGDRVLEALYAHLELHNRTQSLVKSSSNKDHDAHSLPFSLYAVSKMGFMLITEGCTEKKYLPVGDVCVGSTSPLYATVKESCSHSEIAEAAQATENQVKVENINTNLALMKELLFPVLESMKLLKVLATWEDPFKSTVFLVFNLYLIYRGWIRYIFSCALLSLALCMIWHTLCSKWEPLEAFRITPLPSTNAVELILLLRDAASHIETIVHEGNVVLLKLRALIFAAVPEVTEKIAFSLIAVAILVAFLPFEHLVVFSVVEAFTREMPLRKDSSEKFNRRLREWWAQIPAAPIEVVGHRKKVK